MKILFFSSMGGVPWGGSEELWHSAALRALDHGHSVAICVFDFSVVVPQIESLRARGAHIILRPRHPSLLARFTRSSPWLEQLTIFAPESICLSQGSAYECIGRRSTKPLLEWLRSARTPFINIHQFNEPKSDLPASTRARSRDLMSLASLNAFVAARNIDEAAATLSIPIPRPHVLRNPVNLVDLSPIPWPVSPTPRFACVARLHVDAKGQDMLLDALASRPWRHEPWSLSLCGSGSDQPLLQQAIARHSLADRVTFAGQISDIRALWTAHHVLLLPSRAEGTPLALVEAMLLGRPAVVTDVGGCADWITNGTSGFLAEPHTPSVAAALDRLWNAQPHWPALGAAARAAARDLYDPDPGLTLLNLLLNAQRP